MDFNHLRYFQAIAARGNMTAAARDLGVSQPTLTVAIKNLEERLSTTLFLRDRTGVKLTKTGQELLRHVSEIFSLIESAEQRIQGLESDDVGTFVVGCHESLGAYFLPGFMSSFMRESPLIEITLSNDSSANVQRAVLEREVDFGLVVNPQPHLDLVSVELFHDAMDLFVATHIELSPESRRIVPQRVMSDSGVPSVSLETARAWPRAGPLIFAGRVAQCRELLDRLAAEVLLPTRLLSCGDLELVKSLAIAGLGVAMLPRRVAAYNQEGKLRRLHPSMPFFPDTICLLYRADMHRTGAAMKLKDALVAYGRQLESTG
ncbi:MAG: LysR family transcriptional regulator [Polyangiaceae bacterium]